MPTSTTNMNLSIPLSGETNYPTSVSSSFSNIDAHDHTSGKGVQIPAAGLASDSVTTAKIVDLNVTTAKIAANAVTRAKLVAVGQQQSGSIAFTTASTSYVDITGASITITTTGRPVVLMLIADGSATSYVGISLTSPAGFVGRSYAAFIKLVRDATDIQTHVISDTAEQTASNVGMQIPASLVYFDVPGAGTYTYKLQGIVNGADELLDVFNCRLVAYEL